MDRMVSAETPEGNLYLYRYGSEDCLTLSIIMERSAYDAAGRITMQKDGAQYAYDLSGRRIGITTPEGTVQRFSYDAYGNMTVK